MVRTRFLAFVLASLFLFAEGHTSAETNTLNDLFVRDYIRELGHQLAKRLPGEKYSWDIEVIRENQGGSMHEPIAIPERHILVPAPLILAVENEAELAGMLAHSMAHVTAQTGVSCEAIPATGHGTSVLLSSPDLETRRTCELEADQMAVRTVSAAGYDPIGLLEYVRRTQSPATARSSMYSILPSREDRIAALEEELADLPTGGRWSSSEFTAVQEKVRQLTAPAHVGPKNPPTLFREDEQ
jgi:predicted Zn-dependent protease